MGRTRRPDLCMFCGELPCVCGKPAPVAKAIKPTSEPKSRKPVVPPTPVEELINRHAFKPGNTPLPVSQFEDTAPRTSQMGVITRAAVRTDERDSSMKDALRTLLDVNILHPSELPAIARELGLDPHAVRVKAWKAGRVGR